MDFGIFLDFQVRPGARQEDAYRENFELVKLADEIGIDTAWLGETHFNRNKPLAAQLVTATDLTAKPDVENHDLPA